MLSLPNNVVTALPRSGDERALHTVYVLNGTIETHPCNSSQCDVKSSDDPMEWE
jgi:hypothetical protein